MRTLVNATNEGKGREGIFSLSLCVWNPTKCDRNVKKDTSKRGMGINPRKILMIKL
jgi:hypothetical protein